MAAIRGPCRWLAHRISAVELATGALVWWVMVAVLLALTEPLFSPVGLWPLVGGIAALIGTLLGLRPWSLAVVLAVAAVPGMVVLAPLLVLETLNVEQGPLSQPLSCCSSSAACSPSSSWPPEPWHQPPKSSAKTAIRPGSKPVSVSPAT